MNFTTKAITRTHLLFCILGLTFCGCSKHSPVTKSPKSTDLGVVEISSGTPIRRDLGEGKACIIVPTVFTNGSARFVKMTMTIERPDSTGAVQKLACPSVQAIAGEQAEWGVGDIHIRLTTKIKP